MIKREEYFSALEERQGGDLCKKLSEAKVAICGLGGLGSNIAMLLARAGVGKLILADFDRVDLKNIHRQHYRITHIGMLKTEALSEEIREISPCTETMTFEAPITEKNVLSVVKNADIVCEAFDDPGCKAMLTEAVLGMTDKYLVAASGIAGLESPNGIKTVKVWERFYICGDGVSEVGEGSPLLSSRAALCAAHQAHTVLMILAGKKDI